MLLVPKSSQLSASNKAPAGASAASNPTSPPSPVLHFMPPEPCHLSAFLPSCLPASLPLLPRHSPEHRNPAEKAVQALVLLIGGQRGVVLEGRHPLLQQVSLAAAGQGTNPVLLPW